MNREDPEAIEPNFPGGEISSQDVGNPATIEPEACAEQFLKHRAASLTEEVMSGLTFYEGYRAFKDDDAKLERLLARLVGAKVLSQAEADAGRRANDLTVSKLNKIAARADVILHPKILPLLQPGYTVLYEVAKLYDFLEEHYGRD